MKEIGLKIGSMVSAIMCALVATEGEALAFSVTHALSGGSGSGNSAMGVLGLVVITVLCLGALTLSLAKRKSSIYDG